MVKLTQSLSRFLWEKGYKEEMCLMMFGHLELFTEEMEKEYIEWCQTDEGKKYLKGGSEYKEE